MLYSNAIMYLINHFNFYKINDMIDTLSLVYTMHVALWGVVGVSRFENKCANTVFRYLSWAA